MNNVNIYGTIGPSCKDVDILTSMFKAGMDGMRLNTSIVSLEDSAKDIDNVYAAAETIGITPEIIIDLEGPEQRIGAVQGEVELVEEDIISISTSEKDIITVSDALYSTLSKGDEVHIDDGRIKLEIVGKNVNNYRAKIIQGGIITSYKSIAVIGKKVVNPVLTKLDYENIHRMAEYRVTSVMQPMVRSGMDLRAIRQSLITAGQSEAKIYAKIESEEGVDNIDDIIPYADEIVIARGDLGNVYPLHKVPIIQKEIAAKCNEAGKPFMVVTQMLTSMIDNPMPTRAEMNDIYNSVLDGASSLMLTNETTVGKYPVEAIGYLSSYKEKAM